MRYSRRVLNGLAALSVLAMTTSHAFCDEAADAFGTMQSLSGAWKIEKPKTEREKDLRISYQVISAGSAVVETFVRKTSQPTLTVYHRDRSRLIATHYCAQGNQPRLEFSKQSSSHMIAFDFLDATNLESEAQSHLIHLSFDRIDDTHLMREETYSTDGKAETTSYVLTRVK